MDRPEHQLTTQHVIQKNQKRNLQHQNQNDNDEVGQVVIEYYTDPLCCWSWALEPHWQKLLATYGDRIVYRQVLCGMIPDWKHYNDPMNSISKPFQMGPMWMHASEVTQIKMKYSVWHDDPPESSYPPCIAVKTAALQSDRAGEKYLLALRRALMEEGLNIAKPSILLSIGAQTEDSDFNFKTFEQDWNAGNGKEPFRQDWQKAKILGVGRFPTIVFKGRRGKRVTMVGYRSYGILSDALKMAMGEINISADTVSSS
jgi:putative protein-disulfide isomerase